MLMTIRPEDETARQRKLGGAAYPTGAPSGGGRMATKAFYEGIRRYPYSTDKTKTPDLQTHRRRCGAARETGFRRLAQTVRATPKCIARARWTSALWEMLRGAAARQDGFTFQQAQGGCDDTWWLR